MLWENIQCHWTNVGLQRLILMVSTLSMTLEMWVIDLKSPQITSTNLKWPWLIESHIKYTIIGEGIAGFCYDFWLPKSKSLRIEYFQIKDRILSVMIVYCRKIVAFPTKSNALKIMENDSKLRVIFFFGMNSVRNFHGLDLLHFKLLIFQLMV